MIKIGILSISDRASTGQYEDRGIPAVHQWLEKTLSCEWQAVTDLVSDDQSAVVAALKKMVDYNFCSLVLTTGGTGPAPRDITPEATLAAGDREIIGFGEEMRRVNLRYVPTAILSRQTAVVRKQSLIINLPGQPKAVAETLDGIFAAVPYCLELIGQSEWLATNPQVLQAFRPKSAGVVVNKNSGKNATENANKSASKSTSKLTGTNTRKSKSKGTTKNSATSTKNSDKKSNKTNRNKKV